MRVRLEMVLWGWRKIGIDGGMLTQRDIGEADKSVRAPLFGALLYSAV